MSGIIEYLLYGLLSSDLYYSYKVLLKRKKGAVFLAPNVRKSFMNDSLRILNDFYNVKSTLIRIFVVDNNEIN